MADNAPLSIAGFCYSAQYNVSVSTVPWNECKKYIVAYTSIYTYFSVDICTVQSETYGIPW